MNVKDKDDSWLRDLMVDDPKTQPSLRFERNLLDEINRIDSLARARRHRAYRIANCLATVSGLVAGVLVLYFFGIATILRMCFNEVWGQLREVNTFGLPVMLACVVCILLLIDLLARKILSNR